MFISNLGECERSFYLGECNDCNYCKLSNKQDYLIYKIQDKERDIIDILQYSIDIDLKEEFQELRNLKKQLREVTRELNTIKESF